MKVLLLLWVSLSYSLRRCNKATRVFKDSISVTQYNVWNEDDGPNWHSERLFQVFNLLKVWDSDVMILNEIRFNSSRSSDMFQDFCEEFQNYFGIYQVNMYYDENKTVGEGIAVFFEI